uniref:Uncharacterized protein n=1 Tax=Chromera velia CCMP2878 TaxID=1169474 RepID=A0A0G4HYV1_9ALVE|eukprot:Cvel_9590.t1-p1 / transcript=Cvel_9590.t1 / gene=Cvel_9590 / organism=Chromera_velia_CCMP2878 / gene_product=hypothetical protein / transcript_product=hypothetical protein / location=Cvel_scaffold556:48830-57327(+) / protein_length=443 / sequence_SO=supercontig / SO=protein_coding / is_pseudo=false
MHLHGTVNDTPVTILFDPGADENYMSASFIHLHGLPVRRFRRPTDCEGALAEDPSHQVSEYVLADGYRLELDEYEDQVSFTLTDLKKYDLFLGMRWCEDRTKALKKGMKFTWMDSEEMKTAFYSLKEAIINITSLYISDSERPFKIFGNMSEQRNALGSAWRDLGRTFNLPNLGHLSAAQGEVVGHACPACRRVSSVGGLTSFPLCVQPLETPIAPREVDRDASPSADPWERPEETFALQNMGPKDDVCPYLFATPRQKPLAIAGAPLDGRASPAGPRGRLDRSPVGRKVSESSLGPKEAAQELLQVVSSPDLQCADGRAGPFQEQSDSSCRLGLVSNRRAHAYNGNSSPDKDACHAFVMANQDLAFALGPLNREPDSSFTGFTGLADDQRRREFVEGLFPRPAPQGFPDQQQLDTFVEQVVARLAQLLPVQRERHLQRPGAE